MSNAQLYKALKNNKYIVVRNWIGIPVAINCQAALRLAKKKIDSVKMDNTSHIASFYPCSFQEYITKKIGYL